MKPLNPAPDDHFTASPHCRVTVSGSGRVGGAGGCPTIGAGIVSAASVQKPLVARSAPDDHFTAGPHCRVISIGHRARWWCWWLSNCRCWDYICRRCSDRHCRSAAPDDHFTASPHCRVLTSAIGRVGDAGCSPRVIDAASRGTRYCGKRVVSVFRLRYADGSDCDSKRYYEEKSTHICNGN